MSSEHKDSIDMDDYPPEIFCSRILNPCTDLAMKVLISKVYSTFQSLQIDLLIAIKRHMKTLNKGAPNIVKDILGFTMAMMNTYKLDKKGLDPALKAIFLSNLTLYNNNVRD